MFRPVSARAEFGKIEEAALKIWKEQKVFQKLCAPRQHAAQYCFFEIPKTANRKPQLQHICAWIFQDAFLRYHTMCAKHVTRRGAWNTQGLAVEVEAEKRLNIHTKAQLEDYGIENFNEVCRRSTFDYLYNWEKTAERLGCWVDWQDASVTHTREYIESVWWALKSLWDKGLISKTFDVLPYCPRCGTPLSHQEVDHNDHTPESPALYVRLPLVDDPTTSLLVWAPHPWMLSGNVAAAVHPEADYITIEHKMPNEDSERLILAKQLLHDVFDPESLSPQISFLPAESIQVLAEFKGKKLSGVTYLPLFTYLLPDKPAYSVVLSESVDLQQGSGIHPLSPVFSARDLHVALEHGLPLLNPIQPDGAFTAEVRPWRGRFFKDAEPFLIEDLTLRGLVLRGEVLPQPASLCKHCQTPLLNTLCSAWVLQLSAYQSHALQLAAQVAWQPPDLSPYQNHLQENLAWVLSRARSWGTPLPIWVDEDDDALMVGSLEELAQLAECDPAIIDLHRPAIDAITFPNPKTGKLMHRVPDLLDEDFDLAALPAAQWHFPFENEREFENHFPADFACEMLDQAPTWFFNLHTISAVLFQRPAFQRAITLAPPPSPPQDSTPPTAVLDVKTLLDANSADALRWYGDHSINTTQSHPFSASEINPSMDKLLRPLWDVYSFLVTFAGSKGWSPKTDSHYPAQYDQAPPPSAILLDRWLLAALQQLIRDGTRHYDEYNPGAVCLQIQSFIELLSSWYLRHSHQRFWMSGAAGEKDGLRTLYHVLVALCRMVAPLLPFLAEEIYQNLVCTTFDTAPVSVHLTPFPKWDAALLDETLLQDMHVVLRLAETGRAVSEKARARTRRKLRQALFTVNNLEEIKIVQTYADLLMEELGVGQVRAQISRAEQFALHEGQYSLFTPAEGQYQVVFLSEL